MAGAAVTLDELALAPERVSELPADARRLVIARCASIQMAIAALPSDSGPVRDRPDRLLDAKAAAPLLKMHFKTLQRWDDCPFVIVRGRRKFYSALGLERWIAERTT